MKPFSYCSHDLKRLILYQGALDYFFFYKIYGPLLVLVMLPTEIIISATPHTVFRGILMKLSRYCSHDLKVIISLRRETKLKMTQLVSLKVYPFNLNNLEITFFRKLFLQHLRKLKN